MSQYSDMIEEALNELEMNTVPDVAKKATKYGVRKFLDWLLRRDRHCDFASVTPAELNELLRKFYAEVKFVKHGQS